VEIAENHVIDPYKDDFYKELIELRQTLKRRRDQTRGKERVELEVQQNSVKIATNATSYGIFAELNVNDRPEAELSRIFGACDPAFLLTTNRDEQPGRFFHPLLAATITGAARLMLAITERLVTDAGLEWAFCDTDSMAIARPDEMPACQFYEKVGEVVSWFGKLNPYNFGGDILKIEDVNFGFNKNSTNFEPLYVWAVSAKRYVLFNIQNGEPVIRKASAHGLGHFQAPYSEENPASGIPAPQDKLSKIGVERWQHDLWATVAKAAIDGRSDHELKFDFHPALKQPAISRYAATTPKNLKWFDLYNSDRDYSDRIKPFGFVNAFYARNFAADESFGNGKRQSSEKANTVKPVGPFEKDPKRAAKVAFDRITAKRVLPSQLKTYQEALAQYHLHPEDKFLNGDYLDRGTTQRRHVFVTEIQYIGKESNKWEEQYYFGFDAEEQIHYGARPVKRKTIARTVRKIVEVQHQRQTAKEMGISRDKLSILLGNGFAGRPAGFMQRFAGIVGQINSRLDQEKQHETGLLQLARQEVRKIGITEFARRLNLDPANLSKIIEGKRPLSASVRGRLQAYFTHRTEISARKG
jgi:hypothetical protein